MTAHRNITLILVFAPRPGVGPAVRDVCEQQPRWRAHGGKDGRVRAVTHCSVNNDGPELWEILQVAKAVFEEHPALRCVEARIDRSIVEHYK